MASCAPACCILCAIPQAMLRLLATPKTTAILRSRLMAIYAPAPCMGTAKDSSWTAGVSRLGAKDVEPHAGGRPAGRGRWTRNYREALRRAPADCSRPARLPGLLRRDGAGAQNSQPPLRSPAPKPAFFLPTVAPAYFLACLASRKRIRAARFGRSLP